MDERPLVEGCIANICISLYVFEFFAFYMIFFLLFFKKFGFLAILGPPYHGIGATIRIGREMLCRIFVIYSFFQKKNVSRGIKPGSTSANGKNRLKRSQISIILTYEVLGRALETLMNLEIYGYKGI